MVKNDRGSIFKMNELIQQLYQLGRYDEALTYAVKA